MQQSDLTNSRTVAQAAIIAFERRLLSVLVFCALFAILFVTKLFDRIDIPVLVSLLMVILGYKKCLAGKIDFNFRFYFLFLGFLSCYALTISLLHSGQEVIFAFKFIRTLLLFSLLYFVWWFINENFSYERFLKYFSLMAVAHALVVIACVSVVEVREAVYSITGFVPRAPGWLRSPGLTVSYNTPTILHIVALWVLVSRRYWSAVTRASLSLVLIVSLVFMGRTIAFVGLAMIFVHILLLSRAYRRSAAIIVVALLGIFIVQDDDRLRSVTSFEVYSSIQKFVTPIRSFGSADGLDAYFDENLAAHVYFSDSPRTIVFGNGRAGHIGLIDPLGETQSDIGMINSINANGIFVTSAVYLFYLLMFWQVRHADWRTVSFLVALPLALSLKETGLFTSHATPLLFFVFFYNSDMSVHNANV